MRITILTHQSKEGDKTHDVVVDQVAEALRTNGHTPSILGIYADVLALYRGLTRRKPELVFNLMETFGDDELGAVPVAGMLELLDLRYTGPGPGECYLQEDKVLTKKLLAFDGIKYPDFAVFSETEDLETGGRLRMPLFVKPLRMDASIGIDGHSLVRNADEMMKRVLMIHKKIHDSALVEEYIEGREFYVGIVGNQNPIAFPPVEMDFAKMPAGKPHIVDARAKWQTSSPEYKGTNPVVAAVPDELRAKLQKVALGSYRALRVRDYGRIDMRLTESGDIYVIEVNASCYLEKTGEFVRAAEAAGLEYPQLIQRIVEEALGRYSKNSPKKQRRTRSQTSGS